MRWLWIVGSRGSYTDKSMTLTYDDNGEWNPGPHRLASIEHKDEPRAVVKFVKLFQTN